MTRWINLQTRTSAEEWVRTFDFGLPNDGVGTKPPLAIPLA